MSLVSNVNSVLVVPAVSPAANVRDIVELAKKPLLNFSSGGNGVPARMGWARLLKRVFDIDLEHCPQCGGDMKIIAHLCLPARAPPRAPARRPEILQAA